MEPDDFAIAVVGGRVVVSGEIDLATAPLLRATIEDAGGGSAPLVVDLADVTYLDSAAMAVLMRFAHRGLELIVRSGSVAERVLDIGGVLPYVTVTRPDAPGQARS